MRAILITILTVVIFAVSAKAQNQDTLKGNNADTTVYPSTEINPQLADGKQYHKYLYMAVRYPSIAAENNIQGTVMVSFIVEKDGSITHVKVVQGIKELNQEAMRVIKIMPKCSIGKRNGVPVRVSYTVPVSFRLANG
ncbi:MAG: energy transducer TonB [Sphingobacteriales bacterium]